MTQADADFNLCLPPQIAANTEIVILGSFPGRASLAVQQYYAHPRNQFWPLLSALLGVDLRAMPYAERWPHVLARGIGVWDVYAACIRPGSLDSAIRAGQANDFAALRERCPQLRRAGLNGREAGKFAPYLQAAGLQTLVLPSSSPAHAGMSFAQKLEIWRGLLDT